MSCCGELDHISIRKLLKSALMSFKDSSADLNVSFIYGKRIGLDLWLFWLKEITWRTGVWDIKACIHLAIIRRSKEALLLFSLVLEFLSMPKVFSLDSLDGLLNTFWSIKHFRNKVVKNRQFRCYFVLFSKLFRDLTLAEFLKKFSERVLGQVLAKYVSSGIGKINETHCWLQIL